jgi:hypothetical protein
MSEVRNPFGHIFWPASPRMGALLLAILDLQSSILDFSGVALSV